MGGDQVERLHWCIKAHTPFPTSQLAGLADNYCICCTSGVFALLGFCCVGDANVEIQFTVEEICKRVQKTVRINPTGCPADENTMIDPTYHAIQAMVGGEIKARYSRPLSSLVWRGHGRGIKFMWNLDADGKSSYTRDLAASGPAEYNNLLATLPGVGSKILAVVRPQCIPSPQSCLPCWPCSLLRCKHPFTLQSLPALRDIYGLVRHLITIEIVVSL